MKGIVINFFLILLVSFIPHRVSSNPFDGYKIALDPGHGGPDPGAIGSGGQNEKDIVLDIALYYKKILEEYGAEVFITRETSDSMTGSAKTKELTARVRYINDIYPNSLISIHLNSVSSTEANGTETLYHISGTQKDKELAQSIQNRSAKMVKRKDRGIKPRALQILTVQNEIPAVLHEAMFISNKEEYDFLIQEDNKKLIANALYYGLKDFFGIKDHKLSINSSLLIKSQPIKHQDSFNATTFVINEGVEAFTGDIKLALHDNAGVFVGDIDKKENITISPNANISFNFAKERIYSPAGDYELRLFAREMSSDWFLINAGSYFNPKKIKIIASAQFTPSFSLDFSRTALDSIGATIQGIDFITGNNGRPAAKFDLGSGASTDVIYIPNRQELVFDTNEATFDIWLRLDSNKGMNIYSSMAESDADDWRMSIFAKSHDTSGFSWVLRGRDANQSGSNYGYHFLQTYDSSFNCGSDGVDGNIITRNPNIPVGEWFRATTTISQTEGTRFYVNKKLIASCSSARPNFSQANVEPLYLGRFSDYWYPFIGAMQDLRIYKKALTEAEIQNLP